MSNAKLFRVGAEGNPNLVAQQGVTFEVGGECLDLLHNLPVESRPIGYRPTETEGRRLDTHVIRMTLPWRESGQLLCVLRDQELHGASVFPGQAGVARLLREVFLTQNRAIQR